MRQSLAEAAQRFEEVHKATTSEASQAFDEVIASEGASSAQAFAAKLEAVRRNRLGFIHTYKSLRQPQNKESLRLLGPLDEIMNRNIGGYFRQDLKALTQTVTVKEKCPWTR